jgi:SNF2 family DNA or RNA helicase
MYKKFKRDLFLEYEDLDITAVNAAVLVNRLFQFCNGASYREDHSYKVIHDAKLDALGDLISDNPAENMLVAYNYKSDLERLIKRFPQAQIIDKGGAAIAAWNRGEIKMLLAQPQSVAHGVNLQQGGSMIVWFGLCWSLENYQQLNARLHRQGQKDTVRIVHLVTKDTIEDRMQDVLTSKNTTQNDLLTALKRTN